MGILSLNCSRKIMKMILGDFIIDLKYGSTYISYK